MKVWIDNPHTHPKPEVFRELVDQLVKDQGVIPANSPGKLMPIKAYVYPFISIIFVLLFCYCLILVSYSLLDDVHPPAIKLSALYKETTKISSTLYYVIRAFI